MLSKQLQSCPRGCCVGVGPSPRLRCYRERCDEVGESFWVGVDGGEYRDCEEQDLEVHGQ